MKRPLDEVSGHSSERSTTRSDDQLPRAAFARVGEAPATEANQHPPATFMHGRQHLTRLLSVPHVQRGRNCPVTKGRPGYNTRPNLYEFTGPGPLNVGAFATTGTGLIAWNDLNSIHTSSIDSIDVHDDEPTDGAACKLIVNYKAASVQRRCALCFPRDTHAESQKCAWDVLRTLSKNGFVPRHRMGHDHSKMPVLSTPFIASVNKGYLYYGNEGDERNNFNSNAFVSTYMDNPNHMVSHSRRNKLGHAGTLSILTVMVPNKPAGARLLCWKRCEPTSGATAPRNESHECDNIEQVVWCWQDPRGDTGLPVVRIKVKHWDGATSYRKLVWSLPSTATHPTTTAECMRQARVVACLHFLDTLKEFVPCAIHTAQRAHRSGMGGGAWAPIDRALGDARPARDAYYGDDECAIRAYREGNLLEVQGSVNTSGGDEVLAAFDEWGPSSRPETRYDKVVVSYMTEGRAWRAILWSNQTDYRAPGSRKPRHVQLPVHDAVDGTQSGPNAPVAPTASAPAPAAAPAAASSSSASASASASSAASAAASSSSSIPTYEVRGMQWLSLKEAALRGTGANRTRLLTMLVLDEGEAFDPQDQALKWCLTLTTRAFTKKDYPLVYAAMMRPWSPVVRIAASLKDVRGMLGLTAPDPHPPKFTDRWFRAWLRTLGTPHLLILCSEHAAWAQSADSAENQEIRSLAQDPRYGGVTVYWTTKGKPAPVPPAPAAPPAPPPRPKPHAWGTNNLLKAPLARLAYAPYHPFEEWELQRFRNRNRMRDFLPGHSAHPLRGIKPIDFERSVVDKIITTAKSQDILKCADASLVWKRNVIKEIDAKYYNSGHSFHHYPWSEKSDWEAVADAAGKLNVDICAGLDGSTFLEMDRMEMHNLLTARKERAAAEAKRAEEMRAWDAKHAEVSEAAPALSYAEAFKKRDSAARAKAISIDDD